MRVARIREMAIAGCQPEQIKLAFVTLDSPLHTLLEEIQTDEGARIFVGEIVEAIRQCGDMTPAEIYIAGRERLLNACWEVLPRMETSQTKAMVELMDKLQRDIAEARGVIHQRVGRRPRVQPTDPTDPPPASTEAAEEDNPAKTDVDWEGEFEPDDSAEDSASD